MKLQIEIVDAQTAGEARGVVITIDVIRAFTVAGYAFAGGAKAMWLVRKVEEARALRACEPDALLIGEVGGRLIEGFDLNNSPSRMVQANVRNRLLIQRTGAGTQGAVNASGARTILIAALTNAHATALYARSLAQSGDGVITLLPTGTVHGKTARNEDDICADYIQALLEENEQAEGIVQQGINYLQEIDRMEAWRKGYTDFPFEDIEAVLSVNRFPFAIQGMVQRWHNIDYVALKKVYLERLTS